MDYEDQDLKRIARYVRQLTEKIERQDRAMRDTLAALEAQQRENERVGLLLVRMMGHDNANQVALDRLINLVAAVHLRFDGLNR